MSDRTGFDSSPDGPLRAIEIIAFGFSYSHALAISFAATGHLALPVCRVVSALNLSSAPAVRCAGQDALLRFQPDGGASPPPTLFATSTDIVGTSALGGRAIRHHHFLAAQIAASETAPPFPQTSASVCPSWRPDSCVSLTSTHRIGGALSPAGDDLTFPFPGSWLSGSDIAGGRVSSFCPVASRNPGSGTSLRRTIS